MRSKTLELEQIGTKTIRDARVADPRPNWESFVEKLLQIAAISSGFEAFAQHHTHQLSNWELSERE